jgi:DMSO/TMAO reductase YedYZ molybdopterin-dependent catalytic subunit
MSTPDGNRPSVGVSARISMLPRQAFDLARDAGWGLLAGAVGATAATVVMGILRLAWGTLTPPELLAERILPLMSAGDFVAFLIRFQPHPKTTPLLLTLLGQFALGVLLGPLVELAARARSPQPTMWPTRRAWLGAGAVALGMTLLAVVLFWPALPAGVYGNPYGQARLLTILSLALTFGAYAAVALLASHWLRRHAAAARAERGALPAATGVSRREALQAAGVAVVSIAAGGVVVNRLIDAYLARSNISYEGMSTPGAPPLPITPADQFYVVSKNVIDPMVNAGQWRLEVTGLVDHPLSLTLDEVKNLPSERRAITLECISNEVGAHLISTGDWEGIALKTVLDRAGAQPAGTHVVFHGVDSYITSLPLADLLAVRTLLAYSLNGQPLPDRHGFPLRAVVPGRYGEQSAKWVTRIELVDHEVKGFYQSQGWSAAPLETMSRIDTPGRRAARGPLTVAGIAFAGTRGIQRVEVSADGGATWQAATLQPPLSDQTWVFWSWIWRPATAGSYALVVRATDGTGETQTPVARGTVPDGSTGWDKVTVTVA